MIKHYHCIVCGDQPQLAILLNSWSKDAKINVVNTFPVQGHLAGQVVMSSLIEFTFDSEAQKEKFIEDHLTQKTNGQSKLVKA